jgi:hypothetical protein
VAPSASSARPEPPKPPTDGDSRLNEGNGRPWATVTDLGTLKTRWTGDWTVPPAREKPSQVLLVPRDLVRIGLSEFDREVGILRFVGSEARGFYPWYLFVVRFSESQRMDVAECGIFDSIEMSDPERPFRLGFCFDLKNRTKVQPAAKFYFELDKNDSEHLLISISRQGDAGLFYDEDHRPAFR